MPRILIAALGFVCGASFGWSASAPKPAPPNVLVVSDVFSDVPDSLRPKPGKPVYYYLLGLIESDLGTPIRGEKHADPKKVEAEVVKVLASQGFAKTFVGGPMPSIVIVGAFGSATLDSMEMPNNAPPDANSISAMPQEMQDPPPPPPETMTMMFNRQEIMMLVGADKANRSMVDPNQLAQINDAASTSRGYISIAALDLEPMLAKKQKKVLWRTRVSIETLHNSLPDSLGVMLTSAAPFFAREAPAPVLITEADRRKASVEVGTPYVVPGEKGAAPAKSGKK